MGYSIKKWVYIHQVTDLHLIPGVAQAVKQLNEAGLCCCLVSNQSGPARGYYPASHVDALHDRLYQLLNAEAGAHLDALYYCPYLSAPEGGTDPAYTRWSTWRKPNTGMLVAAAWEHDLDLNQSFMVGDKATDVDMAHNAGCTGILVQTRFWRSHPERQVSAPRNARFHRDRSTRCSELDLAAKWLDLKRILPKQRCRLSNFSRCVLHIRRC